MAENINGLRIDKGTVIRYTGKAEEVSLPKDVLRIAPFAFAGCKTLKKIVTPYTLCSIGKGAFYGCDNLEEATLPGKLYLRVKGGKVFPAEAKIYFRFYVSPDPPSEDYDYSDYFDTVDAYLASGIKDEDLFDATGRFGGYVIINNAPVPTRPAEPEEEPVIDEVKPEEEKPEEVAPVEDELPEDEEEEDEPHEEIGLDDVDEDPETLQERMDAVIESDEKDGAAPRRNLVNIGDYLIEGDRVIKYIGSATETKVPEFIRVIGDDAFSNSDVVKVELPPEVDTICKNAFAWCSKLTEINLSESLQMIDDGAFASCQSLEHLVFPEGLKFIGANAFRACCALKELVLPQSLVTVNRRAFDFCVSVEEVILPENITVLAEGVFSHCENLHKAVLPANLKSVGAWAFADCYELREINFPNGLETVGEVAFLNCRSLVAFDMPQSVKSIGRQAFVGCTSLHLVTLPRRLEKQLKPQKVFYRLKSVTFNFEDDNSSPLGEEAN